MSQVYLHYRTGRVEEREMSTSELVGIHGPGGRLIIPEIERPGIGAVLFGELPLRSMEETYRRREFCVARKLTVDDFENHTRAETYWMREI